MVVLHLSSDRSMEGRTSILSNPATSNVKEIRKPRACVPPKVERTKMPKPKNKMVEE